MHYLIVFRSLTYAQRAAKTLERAGILSYMVRPPIEISEKGCSHALKIRAESYAKAAKLIRDAGFAYEAIYRVDGAGKAEEVIR